MSFPNERYRRGVIAKADHPTEGRGASDTVRIPKFTLKHACTENISGSGAVPGEIRTVHKVRGGIKHPQFLSVFRRFGAGNAREIRKKLVYTTALTERRFFSTVCDGFRGTHSAPGQPAGGNDPATQRSSRATSVS